MNKEWYAMGKKEKQCRTYPDARLFIDEPRKGVC